MPPRFARHDLVMTGTAAKGRRAWIVTYDAPRAPWRDRIFSRVEPGQPLAVLNAQLSIQKVMLVVDAFVQSFIVEPDDLIDYLPRGNAPDRARPAGWGQEITAGHNPHVEAFLVSDLRIVKDAGTGTSRFAFTRQPPAKPSWIQARERAELNVTSGGGSVPGEA